MHRAIVCLRPKRFRDRLVAEVGADRDAVRGTGSAGQVSVIVAPGVKREKLGLARADAVRIRPDAGLAGVRMFACPAQRRAMAVYEAARDLHETEPIHELVIIDEAGEGFFCLCAMRSGVAFADTEIRVERVVVEEDRHTGAAGVPWTLRDLIVDAMQRFGDGGAVLHEKASSTPAEPDDVSVVIPHYNDGAFLEQAVASIEAQTLPPREIVLVDDGSTEDASVRMVGELESAGRVRVVRQPNEGLASARNTGWQSCESELIAFLDADDVVMPGWLEACTRAIGRSDASAAAPIVATFDDDPETITGGWCPVAFDAALLGVMNAGAPGSGSVFRRDRLNAVGGFDEAMPAYEDWATSAACASRGLGLAVVPEPLFRYRQREGSLIRRTGRPNHDRWRALISARHGAGRGFADDGRIAQALLDEMGRLRRRLGRHR